MTEYEILDLIGTGKADTTAQGATLLSLKFMWDVRHRPSQ